MTHGSPGPASWSGQFVRRWLTRSVAAGSLTHGMMPRPHPRLLGGWRDGDSENGSVGPGVGLATGTTGESSSLNPPVALGVVLHFVREAETTRPGDKPQCGATTHRTQGACASSLTVTRSNFRFGPTSPR